jgi:hypothetical protein
MTRLATSLRSRNPLNSVRQLPLTLDSIARRTLGQKGFVLKGPQRTLLTLDPCLTNSCVALNFTYHLDFNHVREHLNSPGSLESVYED